MTFMANSPNYSFYSSFTRRLVHQLAIFIGKALAALRQRQFGAENESRAQYRWARQPLNCFFRRRLRGDRYSRRKCHDANVGIANLLRNVAREGSDTVLGDHVGASTAGFHTTATV